MRYRNGLFNDRADRIRRLSPAEQTLNPEDPTSKPVRYSLTFLADQWEWDAELTAGALDQAKTMARVSLEALVQEEKPELACVYLLADGRRVGVWDWMERQSYWTPL